MPIQYEEKNTLIKVKNLFHSFGENKVLEDVNLEIKDIVQTGHVRGQIQCILGPSGVGKTILLRIVAGLLEPTKGEVLISPDGTNLRPVVPGDVGVVWQDYPLFDHLSVLDNLILPATTKGVKKKDATEKARQLLTDFDLFERRHYWPKQLSGGQRQRVAILQQIMAQTLFLIMDEPFSGLDPKAVAAVINLIRKLSESNEMQTLIVVTHDIRAALQVSEYIHLLGRKFGKDGEIVRAGHINDTINLLKEDIAWKDNIRELPKFQSMLNEIEDRFKGI